MLQSVQNVSFEDRAVPKLRDAHDVRVHVEQTGICGSDVHYWQRGRIGDFILDSPIVLGHESAGTVVEVGVDAGEQFRVVVLVVEVEDRVKHPRYSKVIRRTKKVKAHDEHNTAGPGDRVLLMETRPLSATKRWRLVEILEKAK